MDASDDCEKSSENEDRFAWLQQNRTSNLGRTIDVSGMEVPKANHVHRLQDLRHQEYAARQSTTRTLDTVLQWPIDLDTMHGSQ